MSTWISMTQNGNHDGKKAPRRGGSSWSYTVTVSPEDAPAVTTPPRRRRGNKGSRRSA
ncbi:MAG: hypothetical protein R3B70_10000 [Polyangiaceae bacterium]